MPRHLSGHITRILIATVFLIALAGCPTAPEADSTYDPMAVPTASQVQTTDFTIVDTDRSREIPVRVYALPGSTPLPVVLFSHGLGGSRENNPYLGNHWAARGYVCVFLQHPGSDSAVWQGVPVLQRYAALREAANFENFMLRADDVSVVLDRLTAWNTAPNHPLAGRLDLTRIGMSGHSFGAVTTQAVGGQTFMLSASLTDPRIKAAVAFSPSAPRMGSAERAFGSVHIPWMLMTGTEDRAVIGDIEVEDRLAVYPPLPPGGKYELVLFGAEHSAFGDRPLPGETGERNPNHHPVILALTTAFWDTYLKVDTAAQTWLDGDGPTAILEVDDRWQRK